MSPDVSTDELLQIRFAGEEEFAADSGELVSTGLCFRQRELLYLLSIDESGFAHTSSSSRLNFN